MTRSLAPEIRPATPADAAAWDRYVDAHPHGTPFHRTGWARAVGEGLGHATPHLIAESGDGIVGIMPLVLVRSSLTGTRLTSTPLAGYGGPLTDSAEIADPFIDRVRSLTRELGAGHLELHFEDEERVPAAARELQPTDLYAGFRSELPETAEEVIGWLPPKNRRMVRLGHKAGLEARAHRLDPAEAASGRTPSWMVEAHRLVAATMHSLGTPSYSLRMLRQLIAQEPSRWFVWAAYEPGGKMVASVWVALHGTGVFPHFSGGDVAYRKVGVNNFLYATLMEEMIAAGARSFDFGRSKIDSGPYHFKRHFGFEPRPMGYRYDVVDGELPSISPANPRYALAIRLWQSLPLPVTRTLGPALVGHFV